jgi:hypothetical protein
MQILVGQQALGCRHLALELPCPATDSSKGCRGCGCAPGCRHPALALHALSARARPARLAADPGERVCRTACLGSVDPYAGSTDPLAGVCRIVRQDLETTALGVDQHSWGLQARFTGSRPIGNGPKANGSCVKTQFSWV